MMGLVEEKVAGVRRWREYLDALEEERKKIHVFQRELPLCLQLVTQTIESYRQQMGCEGDAASSDVPAPVLEEFVPINRSSTVEEEESSHENEAKSVKRPSVGPCGREQRGGGGGDGGGAGKSSENKTPHWMQSVQLSIRTPNSSDEETELMKPISLDSGKERGAFHPFHRDRKIAPHVAEATPTVPAVSSTADTDTRGRRGFEGKDQGNSNRKTRRCWSPELHRRFLHALKQLGGSHVATPKQIRELMKVDGLSNDEVKSHLQKYRLHTKRPSSTTGGCQTPQFILMGGIWVPPSEYAAAADADAQPVVVADPAPVSRIYAPVASLPSGSPQSNGKKTDVNSQSGEGGCRTDPSSPSTSRSSLIG